MLYYLEFRGRALGPFTEEQLRQNLALGRLTERSRVSTDKISWKELGTCRSILDPPPRESLPSDAGSNAVSKIRSKNEPKVEPSVESSTEPSVEPNENTTSAPTSDAGPNSPYNVGVGAVPLPVGEPSPSCEKLNKSFSWMWRCFIVTFLLLIFSTTIVMIGNVVDIEVISAICMLVSLVGYLATTVLSVFVVYNYVVFFYTVLKELAQRETEAPKIAPGFAVALMFVPVVTTFWSVYLFISIASRLNVFITKRGLNPQYGVSVPLTLVTSVLNFLIVCPCVGQILLFFYMKRVKDAMTKTVLTLG